MSESNNNASSSRRLDPPGFATVNVRQPNSDRHDASPPKNVEPGETPQDDDALDPGTTHVSPPIPGAFHDGPEHRRHRVLQQLGIGTEQFGFRLCRELGRGSFAWVFLAEQVDLAGRLVVLKFSAIEGTEPQTLAQMQHTHIMPIHSLHDNPCMGLRAVCMPYFGGATLAHVLDALWKLPTPPLQGKDLANTLTELQKPLPAPPGMTSAAAIEQSPLTWFRSQSFLRSVVWIAARLAEALHHAHQRGVIHSDIKPTNILLGADGMPLLLDFNVAQNHAVDPHESIVGGTINYSAPEHLQAMATPTPHTVARVDQRSDLYSLGLVLYKMTTGKNPFERDDETPSSPSSLRERTLERSQIIPSARRHRPDLPWSLDSILRKCLAPEPNERYQKAEDLADDLRRFLSDQPLRHAPELSRVERLRKWARRHPRLTSSGSVALAAAILLALAGGVVQGVRAHLRAAEKQLDLTQARERKSTYEAGAVRALCLVNTVTDLPDFLTPGAELCEKTLGLYSALDREDWQNEPAWRTLAPDDRLHLAENTRELLLLLAWARVRNRPNDPDVLQGSLALLDRAERIEDLPPSQALWLDRAHYLEKRGDFAESKKARSRAEELKPQSAQDHYLSAAVFARAGTTASLKKAVAELDRALELNPRHYWALAQRGICRQELGDNTLAIADFSTCIGIWPDFAWGYFNRGYVLGRTGRREHAVRDFSAALSCDPEFVPAYLNRGLIQLELKQFEAALADFDQAQKRGRDDSFLHAGRGVALEGQRRFDEADAAFEKAFASAEQLSETLQSRLYWVYGFAIVERQPEKARAVFDKALRLQPHQPQALYGLAQVETAQNREDTALAFLDQALRADPVFVDAKRARAILAARLGRWQNASQDINWCLEKEPNAGITLYAAACVAARAADKLADPAMTKQALVLLQKAFAQNYGREKAAADPDLTALRTHPDFVRLLAQP